jgi:hypothetical protein
VLVGDGGNYMKTCWAECLGNCSDKISREHIVSKAVFFTDDILIQGLDWCRDKPASIGLASLTAKILCSKHNNDLSKTDSAAAATGKAFKQATELSRFRQQFKRTNWTRRDFKVDGYALESWFLKTLINVTFGKEKLIGKYATQVGTPPKQLVEIAFQRRRFDSPAGLYTIASEGDVAALDGKFRMIILTMKPSVIAGAIFTFSGLRYLLYIDDDMQPRPENFRFHEDQTVRSAKFLKSMRKVRCEIHGKLSHTISFRW